MASSERADFPPNSQAAGSATLSILSLPPELISEILSYLPGDEVSNASAVCKRFHDGSNSDYIWKIRCLKEFGISDISGWNCSYKVIYTKVLYHYGWLIGLWQPERECYGGLISVRMNNTTGRLEAWGYDPPHPEHVNTNLRTTLLFTVELSDGESDREAVVSCQVDDGVGHVAEITTNANKELCFKCLSEQSHHDSDGPERFWRWLQDEYGFTDRNVGIFDQHLYIRKFNAFMKYQCAFDCKRIAPLRFTPGALVQPGFFKGDYSAHGVEVIKLGYTEDRTQLEMLKITGDPNIPAGCITMKAELTCPMVLNLAQQEFLDMLNDMDLPDPDPDVRLDQLPSQPFRIPIGCTRDGEGSLTVPDRCKLRFSARGQVAYDNYTRPTFITAHFIIFDEDTLGFLWMDLQAFCLLKRCTETDLACS